MKKETKKKINLKKKDYLMFLIILIGFSVLWFFPEPQTNFLYYVLTIGVFIGILILINKKFK